MLPMEKSEPTLVPEWLKTSGSGTSGGTTSHQSGSSSSNSDDHVLPKVVKSKLSVSTSDHDLGKSSDRTTSSYFRRSPNSNGSANLRSYNSFSRPHQRDRDKDVYEYHDKDKYRDYFDPLGNILPNRFEKDGLRRSQSMLSSKRGYNTTNKTNHNNGSPIRNVNKAAFERNFPSLGAEERRSEPEIGRVPSPVIQSLPAAVIGGDGWTSALAEVPVIVGSNGSSTSPVRVSSALVGSNSNTNTGLNMAETVAQGPSRVQTYPQLSVETQRLEELAIKQSRQLIPMISSPKTLVLNPSDKPKPKVGPHQHQVPSSLSPHGAPSKHDISKTVNTGKLLVLKPAVRERNGNSPVLKDSLSSPKSVSKPSNTPAVRAPPAVGSAPARNSGSHPISGVADRKPALPILEKRPAPQAQSRNDFFNLMRKKSMTNSPSSASPKAGDPESAVAQIQDKAGGNQFGSPDVNGGDRVSDMVENGKKDSVSDVILPPPEEEEAAFLRSLGWDENAGEEEGLTEEEIKAFKELYMDRKNSRPPSRN